MHLHTVFHPTKQTRMALLPIAALYSGSLMGFPSRRSLNIIITSEDGLLDLSKCLENIFKSKISAHLESFARSLSMSDRFWST